MTLARNEIDEVAGKLSVLPGVDEVVWTNLIGKAVEIYVVVGSQADAIQNQNAIQALIESLAPDERVMIIAIDRKVFQWGLRAPLQ